MTSKDLIRVVGEALWGPRWQSDMAHHLGIGDRTIRRWAAGETQPAEPLWGKLLAAIDERQEQLAQIREKIARYLKPGAHS
jgi:hypothetical protein